MNVITGRQRIAEPVCLMIGNFDGVHLGHQAIIAQARALAERDECKTVVLSFEPHPLKVIAPHRAPLLLQTPSQKEVLLAAHDVDYYVIKTFDEELYTRSPEDFVAFLKERVNFKHLLVGFNFRFGHQRQGDTDTLLQLAETHGFQAHIIPAYQLQGKTVSSSRIRALITDGETEQAAELLGRPYFLEGVVALGKQLGRHLSTPTANFEVAVEQKPRYGVYASWCRVVDRWYRAITNFGVAPTLARGLARCETFLFDFEGSLYGQHLTVTLGRFLREETQFDNLADLKTQIACDVVQRGHLPDTQPPDFHLNFQNR